MYKRVKKETTESKDTYNAYIWQHLSRIYKELLQIDKKEKWGIGMNCTS